MIMSRVEYEWVHRWRGWKSKKEQKRASGKRGCDCKLCSNFCLRTPLMRTTTPVTSLELSPICRRLWSAPNFLYFWSWGLRRRRSSSLPLTFQSKTLFLNFDNHSLCTFTAFTKPNYSALGNDLATRGALSFVFFFCFFFENFVVDAYASFYLTSYFSTVTTVLPSKKIIIMDLTLQYKWNEKYYKLFNEIYILGAIW